MGPCFWLSIICYFVLCNGWASGSRAELRAAIAACLELKDYDCSKGPHEPIGSWDVSAVTDMKKLFLNGNSLFSGHFSGTDKFSGDLSKWNVSKVTNMAGMFYSASSFNSDLSKWDVATVTDMHHMFNSASSFNGDISKWDVSRVTSMYYMFMRALSFNVDLSKWDVSRVTDMREMFWYTSSFTRTLCGTWVLSTAKGKSKMFWGSWGSLAFYPDVCIPTWTTYLFVLAAIALVVAVVLVLCWIARVKEKLEEEEWERWRVYRRFEDYGETRWYQNKVRRQWLRAIHALVAARGKDGDYDFPRTIRAPRDVRRDRDLSQLVEFFRTYRGLLRQTGAMVALYYSPCSAPPLRPREHGRNSQVVVPI